MMACSTGADLRFLSVVMKGKALAFRENCEANNNINNK